MCCCVKPNYFYIVYRLSSYLFELPLQNHRRQQQMRNLERKIEKLRGSLHEEDLVHVHGSEQDIVSLQMEDKHHDDKPHRCGVVYLCSLCMTVFVCEVD